LAKEEEESSELKIPEQQNKETDAKPLKGVKSLARQRHLTPKCFPLPSPLHPRKIYPNHQETRKNSQGTVR
jgi:hypothetical protein